MRREKQAEGWTWIPAEPQTQGRSSAIAVSVLAIACLSVGIVIGRISVSTQDDRSAEQGSTPAQLFVPTAPEASRERSGASTPEPSAAKAEAPILALGSESRDKRQAATVSPAPAGTPALVNPDAAQPPRSLEDERQMRWKRALAKTTWNSRSSRSVGRQAPGRDYQALRDYVLSK
jgi:hypothetical protein